MMLRLVVINLAIDAIVNKDNEMCAGIVSFGLCRKRYDGCKGFDENPSVVASPVDLKVIRVS
jgi:hypothetical protein